MDSHHRGRTKKAKKVTAGYYLRTGGVQGAHAQDLAKEEPSAAWGGGTNKGSLKKGADDKHA